jgi:hypothetical protein
LRKILVCPFAIVAPSVERPSPPTRRADRGRDREAPNSAGKSRGAWIDDRVEWHGLFLRVMGDGLSAAASAATPDAVIPDAIAPRQPQKVYQPALIDRFPIGERIPRKDFRAQLRVLRLNDRRRC